MDSARGHIKRKEKTGARGVECLWGDLKTHPQCVHGNFQYVKQ